MVGAEITPKVLARRYAERAGALGEKLEGLDERPTPVQIHDLRVAARRAQVLHLLLPRENRRARETRSFNIALKSVRKVTSEVRDTDTLTNTLEHLRPLLPVELITSLENDRSDIAAKASSDLAMLHPVAPTIQFEGLGRKKLSRRFRKRVKQSRKAIDLLLGRVLSDESRVEDLHSLRKEAKKLRYLLELSRIPAPELRVLGRWQESLGAIRDLDVAMAYLEASAWDFPKLPALRELRKDRRAKYLKFVHEQEVNGLVADEKGLQSTPLRKPARG
jgi:CHAD domain-containing protein